MADWRSELQRGAPETAWDLFISRYRRLIFAAIRHYAQDYDDVMDVFARVCEALREDNLRRLRTWHEQPAHRARFSTWLVAVVRNLTVDWFRHRDGRRRLGALAQHLPPLRQQIFEHVFLGNRSHVEAYELICSRDPPGPSFRQFLIELRATYKDVGDGKRGRLLRELSPLPPPPATPREESDPFALVEAPERREWLDRALSELPHEDRLAVEFYVVEELPAADIARILGLPNAKAVYNRVYRALDALKLNLSRVGIGRQDL